MGCEEVPGPFEGRKGVGVGTRAAVAVSMAGDGYVALSGALVAVSSSFDRICGKGGRDDGSYTGALTRPVAPSIEGVLDVDVRAVVADKADIEDTLEVTEDIDSFESLLFNRCSEGLRGGRLGDG